MEFENIVIQNPPRTFMPFKLDFAGFKRKKNANVNFVILTLSFFRIISFCAQISSLRALLSCVLFETL